MLLSMHDNESTELAVLHLTVAHGLPPSGPPPQIVFLITQPTSNADIPAPGTNQIPWPENRKRQVEYNIVCAEMTFIVCTRLKADPVCHQYAADVLW